MSGYLCIVLMLAGVVCLTSGELFGEFMMCQIKAHKQCTESNPTFTDLSIDQISYFFRENDNRICSKKDDFSKLLTCYFEARESCLDGDDKQILATATAEISALNQYCSKMNDTSSFNITCIMESNSEVNECTKGKTTEVLNTTPNTTIAEYKVFLCSQLEYATSCYKEHLTSCQSTNDNLMEIMMLVKPAACSGMSLFYNSILIFFSLYLFKCL